MKIIVRGTQNQVSLIMSVAEANQLRLNCIAIRLMQNVDTSALKQFDEIKDKLHIALPKSMVV